MTEPRTQHTATLVQTTEGDWRVVLIGGKSDPGTVQALDSVEILSVFGATFQ
jgi:hypothetical protein